MINIRLTVICMIFMPLLSYATDTPSLPTADDLASSAHFEVQREFPNYFLPEESRHLDASAVPERSVLAARKELENALHSVFKRLTIAVVKNDESFEVVRYFDFLQTQLPSGVKVMPSGGVVRSAIGYVYAELYNEYQNNPQANSKEVLRRIGNDRADLPGFLVRGIGSDFDVLVQADAARTTEAISTITDITNSAETHFGATNVKGDAKRSLFTIGDAKDYQKQIELSTGQGGATIDFLAFDMDAGNFVEPEGSKYIINDLIVGLYRYISPKSGQNQKDPDKQTVRGIRALLELPFISLLDDTILRKEISSLTTKVKSGSNLSAKALDQFSKIVRNARFSGAKNRIFRGSKGSIEQEILGLNDQLASKGVKELIPEFVDQSPIDGRDKLKSELNGLPAESLISISEFLKNHTHNGMIYHGTPELNNALAIMRGGLFISGGRNRQGGAAYGSGGYSIKDYSFAKGYSGARGVVFNLQIRNDEKLNIVHASTIKSDPKYQQARERSIELGIDFHQYLARYHGIDIIQTSGPTLILNTEAVHLDHRLEMVLDALYSQLTHREGQDIFAMLTAYKDYKVLAPYAVQLGLKDIKPLPKADDFFKQITPQMTQEIEHTKNLEIEASELVIKLHQAQPELFSQFGEFIEFIRNPDKTYQGSYFEMIGFLKITPETYILSQKLRTHRQNTLDLHERRQELSKILQELAQASPTTFSKHFSHQPELTGLLENMRGQNLVIEPSGIQLDNPDLSEIRRTYGSIILKAWQGQRLTKQEITLVDSLIINGNGFGALQTLIGLSKAPVTVQLLDRLKNAGAGSKSHISDFFRNNVAGGVTFERDQYKFEQDILARSQALVRYALGADQRWRQKILALDMEPDQLARFPWDLRLEVDRQSLKRLLPKNAKQEMVNVLHWLQADEGYNLRADSIGRIDNIEPELIENLQLRQRFTSARNDYKRVVNRYQDFGNSLRERQPKLYEQIVAGRIINSSSSSNKSEMNVHKIVYKVNHEEKGLKALSADELRLIRISITQPIQSENIDNFRELLKEKSPFLKLTLNRVLSPKPTDSPLAFLELAQRIGHGEAYEAIVEQLNKEPLRKQIKGILLSSTKDIHRSWIFNWNLFQDLDDIKKLVENHYHPKDLKRSQINLVAELYRAQPELFSNFTSFHYFMAEEYFYDQSLEDKTIQFLNRIPVHQILSKKHQQQKSRILTKNEQIKSIDIILKSAANSSPLLFARNFGSSSVLANIIDRPKTSITISSNGVGLDSKGLLPAQITYGKIIDKAWRGIHLSDADLVLIDYLTKHSQGESMLKVIIGLSKAPITNQVLDSLRSGGKSGAVITANSFVLNNRMGGFYFPDRGNGFEDKIEKRTNILLANAIGKDRKWRDRVLSLELKSWQVDSFPWDLRIPEDIQALKRLFPLNAKSEMTKVMNQLKKVEGLPLSLKSLDFTESIHAELITNENLRRRYIKAHLNYLRVTASYSSLGGAPLRQPELYDRYISDRIEYYKGNQESRNSRTNKIIYRVSRGDLESLSANELQLVRKTISRPLTVENAENFSKLLDNKSALKTLALNRAMNLRANDDLIALLLVLKDLSRGEPYEKIRSAIDKEPLRSQAKYLMLTDDRLRGSQFIFPWEIERDVKDILAFAGSQPSSIEKGRSEIAFIQRLYKAQPSLFSSYENLLNLGLENSSKIAYFIRNTDPSLILSAKLRKERERIYSVGGDFIRLDNILSEFAGTDPKSFVEHFSNYPQVDHYLNSGGRVLSITPTKIDTSSDSLNRSKKIYGELILKAWQGVSFDASDLRLVDYLIMHSSAETVFLKVLIGLSSPEVTDQLTDRLKNTGNKGIRIIPKLLSGRYGMGISFQPDDTKSSNRDMKKKVFERSHRILSQFISSDRELRRSVLKLNMDSAQFTRFPWDLSIKDDVLAINRMINSESEADMIRVMRELKYVVQPGNSNGILYHVDNINPDMIKDVRLKNRFKKARRDYERHRNGSEEVLSKLGQTRQSIRTLAETIKSPGKNSCSMLF